MHIGYQTKRNLSAYEQYLFEKENFSYMAKIKGIHNRKNEYIFPKSKAPGPQKHYDYITKSYQTLESLEKIYNIQRSNLFLKEKLIGILKRKKEPDNGYFINAIKKRNQFYRMAAYFKEETLKKENLLFKKRLDKITFGRNTGRRIQRSQSQSQMSHTNFKDIFALLA